MTTRMAPAPAAIKFAAACACIAVLGIFGCGSPSKQTSPEASGFAQTQPVEAVPDLVRAANCIVSSMQNPKEPFHLSLSRKDDDRSEPYTSEADFTSNSLDGNSNWRAGQDTQKLTNLRSDANAWDASVMLLAAPLTQSAISDLRIAQSTATVAGPDPVGGYDATKYVFDSARLSDAEKTRYAHLMRAQDLNVTGAAWITNDTHCLVKYVTDYKFTSAKDASTGSVHNEGSITKK